MIPVLTPLQASSPLSRPYSIFMHRSSMNVRPASPAIARAFGAPDAELEPQDLGPDPDRRVAISGTSSGRRKTSTTSTGTGIDSRSG